jgi:hypothetical protein
MRARLRNQLRRGAVWTIMHGLPVRFDGDAARDLDTVIEVRIRPAAAPNGAAPDCYELVIERGRCRVRHRPSPRAAVAVTIGGADLVRLAAGTAAWPQLLGDGRLQLAGDPFLALRFPTLFRLPAKVS